MSVHQLRADAVKRENRAESKRQRRRFKPTVAQLRITQLCRLFEARYRARQLPDDDAGRDDLLVMAHHLAVLVGNPETRIRNWCAAWAPWLSIAELDKVTSDALRYPRRWKADRIAWRLGVTDQERRTLKLTTIGAIDCDKGTRSAQRRIARRLAMQARRRAKGSKPRHEYEANSLARTQPWKAAGMSRATYYRHLKAVSRDE